MHIKCWQTLRNCSLRMYCMYNYAYMTVDVVANNLLLYYLVELCTYIRAGTSPNAMRVYQGITITMVISMCQLERSVTVINKISCHYQTVYM